MRSFREAKFSYLLNTKFHSMYTSYIYAFLKKEKLRVKIVNCVTYIIE
jgi:hypothetical protein